MAPIVEETQLGGPRMTKLTCLKSFVPLVFAVAAIIIGTAGNFYCETVKFTQDEGYDGLVLMAGPFNYKTKSASEWADSSFATMDCRNYDVLKRTSSDGFSYEENAATRTVWAFAFMTPLLGALVIVMAFFSATCASGIGSLSSRGTWRCLGPSFLVTGLFQGLTLLVQSSSICNDNPAIQYLESSNLELAATFPEECQVAAGYALIIAATALWILAGLSTYILPPPLVIHEHPRQEQTVTYTQHTDGTVEEARVNVVKGTPVQK